MADIKKKIRENLRKTYPDMSDRDMDKSVDRFIRNIDKMLPTPDSKMNGTVKKADGGMMKKNLKPVDKKKNPGLAKLPTGVRNKMGYMKDGGAIDKKKGTRSGLAKYRKKENMTDAEARKKLFDQLDAEAKRYGQEPTPNKKKVQKKKEGGMVLEIGLRPATKQEMKMAKEMKPQKKANGGMVSRGTGKAIRGKGFKGVF